MERCYCFSLYSKGAVMNNHSKMLIVVNILDGNESVVSVVESEVLLYHMRWGNRLVI